MLVALRPPVRFQEITSPNNDQLAFLEKRFTPRTVFMEIGAADCVFALRAASNVERVYAIDVSGRFLHTVPAPANLRLVLCDGVRIPLPEALVDLAWGGSFMDHLHPDDAARHLQSVRRSLVSGGEYLFTTQQPPALIRRRLRAAGFSGLRIALLSRLLKPLRVAAIR
jgi:SAM-dependent methyltransferase